jgi:hypothetical protein
MRPEIGNPTQPGRWKRWLDRLAVAWIVTAPLLALAAGWMGLRPAPGGPAAAEVQSVGPIQYRFPKGEDPSASSAESRRSEPLRTVAVRPRR